MDTLRRDELVIQTAISFYILTNI